MVLAELGERLTAVRARCCALSFLCRSLTNVHIVLSPSQSLRKMQATTVVDEEVLDQTLKDISRALLESDVNVKLVGQLRNNIKSKVNLDDVASGVNRHKLVKKTIIDELVEMVGASKTPYQLKKGKPNVIMFVGLQGSGKTTTIAKYANHYARKGWKCCMVCADTFRAGAFDQLKQNATKLRIPFYGSHTEPDPIRIAEEGVAQFKKEKYEIIIIDTSGRHKQEGALFEEMEEIHAVCKPDDTIFVMDSTIGQAVSDQAAAFRESVDIGSVIITKLDGHAKGGGALSAVAATDSPIIFIGLGEHFDDLELFNPKGFISRLLGMGDIDSLINDMKEIGIFDSKAEFEKLTKGSFTLRDMYEELQNVMKLGPLDKVMGMIPGIPDFLKGSQADHKGKMLKRYMHMMDSMTNDELDGKLKPANMEMHPSRIWRVALGSGSRPHEVVMLLRFHQQFEDMVNKMGKTGVLKNEAVMDQQMTRNPNQVKQQLSRAMDPRVLQQMGGVETMMTMMKHMQKNGGSLDGSGGGSGSGSPKKKK